MTAEIGIMNRIGVALAADSAVTFGCENSIKIYQSANKLFALSKYHPVGIMIYGNATFMGVPWEIIIKLYRDNSLKNTSYKTLAEYTKEFIIFIKQFGMNLDTEIQDDYYKQLVRAFGTYLYNRLDNRIKTMKINDEKIYKYTKKNILYCLIDDEFSELSKMESIKDINNKPFDNKIKKVFSRKISIHG